MAITPKDIQEATFSEAKRGYDPAEVDAFLETLSAEVDAMLNKIVDLKTRLTNAESELASARAQAENAALSVAPAPAQDFSQLERQISAALITAQQSADTIVEEARVSAERIRSEADAKAREVIRQALAEKQNELDEIDRLKTSREDFRNEYMKLLQHFMDEASNTFPSDLLTATPSGSAASEKSAVVVAEPVAPAPVADPFAPLPAFDVEDLD